MAKAVVVCAADLRHTVKAREILENIFDVRYVQPTAEAVAEHLADAAGYYASLHVKLTKELMDQAPGLKAIATPSTGLDHLDLDEAARRDIEILCLKYDRELLDKITSTAELAWMLALGCSRHFYPAVSAARRGHWARDLYRGHQLSYRTFGILGCGRLGTIMSEYARAFRMEVLGNDIRDVNPEGVTMVPLDELLARSEILSVHIHLTEENRRFMDGPKMAKMREGAILINTSRGAIVDEAAVLEMLESGHLSAYGTDVIEGEWREDLDQHPLIRYMQEHDNVLITPHIGGVCYESQDMACAATAQKLVDFLT